MSVAFRTRPVAQLCCILTLVQVEEERAATPVHATGIAAGILAYGAAHPVAASETCVIEKPSAAVTDAAPTIAG